MHGGRLREINEEMYSFLITAENPDPTKAILVSLKTVHRQDIHRFAA
jgi:hypothetical protein